jgi:hypothetical protein
MLCFGFNKGMPSICSSQLPNLFSTLKNRTLKYLPFYFIEYLPLSLFNQLFYFNQLYKIIITTRNHDFFNQQFW